MLNDKNPAKQSAGLPLIPENCMAGALSGVGGQWMEYECEHYVIPGFAEADFLITVMGDSMQPTLASGDVLAVKRVEASKLWFQWGKIYGIAIDLRNMRAAINWAIDNGITDNYPFRRYFVKTEETRKRDMSDEQLAELKAHQGSVYVDILLLLIYLRGINISDLLTAEPSQIRCGRLEYRRNKTGQLFSVKIEPEAQTIIDKYKGNEHLLYILDSSRDYHTFLRNMNRRVKKYVPGISSYWSRHTVASIASRLDIPTDVIGRVLGHADPVHSTTNIYINFDISKVDRAMRKVIDYINGI